MKIEPPEIFGCPKVQYSRDLTVCPVSVDHSKEDEIKKLFDKVAFGENGQLDILVNNAYAAVKHIDDNIGKPFWEHGDPAYGWDIVNNVGLRNHFICSTYAAR